MDSRRVLYVALAVSTVFHLSMVTVFSISVWLPVETINYYTFDIVEVDRPVPVAPPPTEVEPVPLPSLNDELTLNTDLPRLEPDQQLQLEPPVMEPVSLEPALPEIELPRLQFAELERIRLREEGFRVQTRYRGLGGANRDDLWARFGEELDQLRGAFARLPFSNDAPEEDAPMPVSRPAEGIAVYIEWMGEPKDRDLLFSPPIDALWKLDPDTLTEPISLVFRVSPEGEVIEVMAPVEDEEGVVASAGKALTRYRFAPVEGDNVHDQHGTLLIAPDRESSL